MPALHSGFPRYSVVVHDFLMALICGFSYSRPFLPEYTLQALLAVNLALFRNKVDADENYLSHIKTYILETPLLFVGSY